MRTLGLAALSTSAFIACMVSYLKYDCEGYDYGVESTICDYRMPYNLKPHDGIGLSFTLKDEDDYELVGAGFRYRKSTFKIKDFLSYGYNDVSIVVKCTDSIGAVRYLASYETGYKSRRGNPEISFRDIASGVVLLDKDKYRWIDIDEERAIVIARAKTLSLFGAVFSLLVCTGLLLRKWNQGPAWRARS